MQAAKDLTPLLKKLAGIKRLLGTQDYFRAEANDEQNIAVMQRAGAAGRFVGVFSLQAKSAGSASLPQTARMRTFWTAAPSRSKPAASTAMARL